MRSLSIESILDKVDELPEIPQIAIQVMNVVNDPDSNVMDLSNIVSKDQGLTAKLLRLCNSAFYGVSRKITTVTDAVSILGFNTVKSIVLMATTYNTVNKSLSGYGLKQGELWEHSLYSAHTARYIADLVKYNDMEEAFIAGLLHDIGKIVLNQHALPEVFRATNLSKAQETPLYKAEQDIIGFDHAMTGAALAERWNFPVILVESIKSHHEVDNITDENILGAITMLANIIALISKDGVNDMTLALIPNKILNVLGISDFGLNRTIMTITNDIAQIIGLMPAIA